MLMEDRLIDAKVKWHEDKIKLAESAIYYHKLEIIRLKKVN